MSITTAIEIIAVVLNFLFLILLIREIIWCWLFGILSSLLSIYLFWLTKLYSESILYFFYVLIGIYGWVQWSESSGGQAMKIKLWPALKHLLAVGLGTLLSFSLGWFFRTKTDAANPFADAFSTIFSFIASFMEAHKILSAWIFWILINGFSVWLYSRRGLYIYAGLMIVYFGLSIYGFWEWRRKLGLKPFESEGM